MPSFSEEFVQGDSLNSQTFPDDPTTDVAPASSVPAQSSASQPSLRAEVLKFLGPFVCPPAKSAIREPRSSTLQQRLLQSVEEMSSDRSFPEGNLVPSCLSHIQGARSGSFYDDLPVGDAAPSIVSALAVSHIGVLKSSSYAVHDARLSPDPVKLEENFDRIMAQRSVSADR